MAIGKPGSFLTKIGSSSSDNVIGSVYVVVGLGVGFGIVFWGIESRTKFSLKLSG